VESDSPRRTRSPAPAKVGYIPFATNDSRLSFFFFYILFFNILYYRELQHTSTPLDHRFSSQMGEGTPARRQDETLTELDAQRLLETSLKTLGKTLSPATSTQATMALYLRWLEVHRREPTRLSEPWDNCMRNWAQALKSRGLSQHEVIDELRRWKATKGPFPAVDQRHVPTPDDVLDAFNGRSRKGYTALENYQGPPPKNYVCNRCSIPGMSFASPTVSQVLLAC
jgi:hypothetical protein